MKSAKLLKAENEELKRRLKSFERMTSNLADEVDRQRKEIEMLKGRRKTQRINSFLKVA